MPLVWYRWNIHKTKQQLNPSMRHNINEQVLNKCFFSTTWTVILVAGSNFQLNADILTETNVFDNVHIIVMYSRWKQPNTSVISVLKTLQIIVLNVLRKARNLCRHITVFSRQVPAINYIIFNCIMFHSIGFLLLIRKTFIQWKDLILQTSQ